MRDNDITHKFKDVHVQIHAIQLYLFYLNGCLEHVQLLLILRLFLVMVGHNNISDDQDSINVNGKIKG